ncbi:hypothetical protein K502DRAFT_362800 [Neoconidiobolus thromboides FSU 785]|nr:hypothetical protein K502DRAFT_362800 [Neoconidiobolus thromboides FSU 785]
MQLTILISTLLTLSSFNTDTCYSCPGENFQGQCAQKCCIEFGGTLIGFGFSSVCCNIQALVAKSFTSCCTEHFKSSFAVLEGYVYRKGCGITDDSEKTCIE